MGGSSKSQTVGYKYYLGMHQALCHGPVDKLIRIRVDRRCAWVGDTASGRVNVSAESLFGGESREGGVSGAIDFEPGASDQGQNDYLAAKISADVPNFRGVCAAVLRQVYVGMNPYLKAWDWRVQRIHTRQDGIAQWYDAKAAIITDFVDFAANDDYLEHLADISLDPTNPLDIVDLANPSYTAGHLITGLKTSDRLILKKASSDVNAWSHWATDEEENSAPVPWANGVWICPFDNFADGYKATFWDDRYPTAVESALHCQSNTFSFSGASSYRIQLRDTPITDNRGMFTASVYRLKTAACQYGILSQRDMNPAHIIRECLTDPNWGMGYPEADMDDAAFMAAADTLWAEKMGISILWDRQIPLEDFIKEILKHIDAVLYVDRTTGKFVLKLIRDDYDAGTLLVLNEDNCERVDSFKTPALGELVNSITINYWDSASGNDASLTVHDTALAQLQGGVVNTTVEYPGFTNGAIAARIAARDLKSLSTPIVTCTIYANREASGLNVGGVFKLQWPEYGIGEMVMRVTAMAYGDGKNNRIRIQATQDVFSLPEAFVASPPSTGWINPVNMPAPSPNRLVIEAPYYEVVQQMGQAEADAELASNPERGYLMVAGDRPSTDALHAVALVDSGAGYTEAGVMDFAPSATLLADVGAADTTLPITAAVDLDLIVVGSHAQIGNELVRVDTVGTSSLTVGRGCLDTVPMPHAAGTVILAWDRYAFTDQVEYADGETLTAKLLTVTGLGQLGEAFAPAESVTMDRRALRPYPPGNFKVGGNAYPVFIGTADGLVLTWSHRDRIQQTAGDIVDTTAGNIGPEVGTTYTVRVYKEDMTTLIHEATAIAGTTHTYTFADEVNDSAILTGGSSEMYYNAVMADTPYAYYRMGEASGTTAIDSSGNRRNGTYGGGVTLGQPGMQDGDSNTCAHFDPTTDQSQLDTGINTNFTAFTLEFIINPDTTQPDAAQYLFSKSSYYATSTTDFPASVTYSSSGQSVTLVLSKGDDFSKDVSLNSGAGTVPKGARTIVHAVYRQNGQCEIWTNGVMRASTTINFAISTNTRNWMIAAAAFANDGGVGQHRLAGYMDEAAIYNYALSATRIAAHAAAMSTLPGGYRQNGKLRIELESVRDGKTSYQAHDHTVRRAGYGFNYGESYGGI